jgi:glycosyltransferase involved in cell wall biosynthesis
VELQVDRAKRASDGSRGLIIHEWIEEVGGAEKVLDQFSQMFPAAEICCLWNDRAADANVTELLAAGLLRGRKALTAAVAPLLWSQMKMPQYEWALISSHMFAHHAATNRSLRSIPTYAYVHTPARYIWNPELDERGKRSVVRAAAPLYKRIDANRAKNLTGIAANSSYVQDRIQRTWGLESEVIYPPVEVSRIVDGGDWSLTVNQEEANLLAGLPDEFLLGFSRLVQYKQIDLVLEVGERSGRPVVIAGTGPDLTRLRALSASMTVPVHFLGFVSDNLLYALYQRALALVFPAVEDFGIVPVEAMAAGLPVLTRSEGGASETVVDGISGIHVDFASTSNMIEAVDRIEKIRSEHCKIRAAEFDSSNFRRKIRQWVFS